MTMTMAVGTKIGPYDIAGWLGAGGMGEVYRARDPRFGRDVAIKLILATFAADASRVRRFEQEARAAGQLNHPNILAVYDAGLHDGAPYIVSELLEGESLRSRLHAGPLPSRKAIDYARQIAEGLAAAHDKNIVHRDVKPDNLFVTTDGRIKILDFGVAKLTVPSGDVGQHTALPTETGAGMVVGTAGYMSPEQVRGENVDTRSDIFSVGSVLYEMLTGRQAFGRETTPETMTAILRTEPEAPLPADVPPALARIVARCLEKTREMRFQSARDLAFALEVMSDTAGTAAPGRVPPPPRRWRTAAGIALVALSVITAVASWLTRRTAPVLVDHPLANAQFSRFTDWEGTEKSAEISPDGKFVAFLADKSGKLDIWLSQVGTGRFVNLTQDLPPIAVNDIVRPIGFSGDGADIWFTTAGDGGRRKMLIPLTGGTPRPFLGEGAAGPSWSPDGRRLAYFLNGSGDPLFVADRTGTDPHPVVVNQPQGSEGFFDSALHNHNPVWSPDGQWIYLLHGADPTNEMDVWRVRPSGGWPERLTNQNTAATFMAPLDARTLLYVGRTKDPGGPWLWALDVERKVTRRISSGLEQYTSVAASADGHRLVASVANPSATLWSVPLLDRIAEDRDAQPYPLPTARGLAPRFGGTSLFFLSSRGTGDGLWRVRNGQATELWNSADGALSDPPAVSHDGRLVAIVVRKDGKRRLMVMSDDGTNARTLNAPIEIQGATGLGTADWSPDGKWIVTGGSDAQGAGLFKIPVAGGAPTRLVSGPAINPIWSPDGALIVYAGPFAAGQAAVLGVRPDGTPVVLPDVRTQLGGGYRFLPDSTALVYLPRLESLDFWRLDFATGKTRRLTRFGNRGTLNAFDVTPDGKAIVFDRMRANSNIVLIDVPR